MIGGLIRSFSILFLLSSCFAVIIYPKSIEYTLAQLPEKLVGYVNITEACFGNVSLVYDGKEIFRKFMNFDTGTLVAYNTLLNFSIPKEVGNHTIEIVSECFPREYVNYSVTDKIPVIFSYNTNKLMVGEEFKLDVFGEHVTIRFNNRTFTTHSFRHIFERPGNYTIEIEVWDDFGDHNKKTILVTVSDRYLFNYSFDSTTLPGEQLEVRYSLHDFFGRNLTDKVVVRAFGRTYVGDGTVVIIVPDDARPGSYVLSFSYKDWQVNKSVFIPRVLKIFDLDLDRNILNKNEPVHVMITALDQTGEPWNLTCELLICKKNCTNMRVPTNTEFLLDDLYWRPGHYTITARCLSFISKEHLLVPKIQNLSYNYSVTGDTTMITLKNTGNVPVNATLVHCSTDSCKTLNISLKKNETRTIPLKGPGALFVKYANKTLSLPITGRFFLSFNPWLIYASLLGILVLGIFAKLR